ncbi:acidic mammalian chitinase-like [Anopheles ziemanni]|uniref:acidic mammalian chitinase-like n=1 Tax=Anopheles coustani TaxID=139045 RepID=UPI0026582591|nr:acidic mammalian chitinase-like [Anopheles coustani]XP_058177164.1 acidic mammalian chitinase-like [Anopheles ziemanni]
MPSKLIFGYYGSWATYRSGKGKYTAEDIDPYSCTHLIYAFASPTSRGDVRIVDYNLGFAEFNGLRNRNPSLKTLIGIGGANLGERMFYIIAGNPSLRRTFAENTRRFCHTHDFNGVDIDWEFPESGDRYNFVQMLSDLSSELGRHGLLLTVSVGPSEYRASQSYDIPGIARNVDYILLMTYDYNGSWDAYTGHNAPLYSGSSDSEFQKQLYIDHSVRYWKRQGAPSHKLILGLATFGRTFTLSNPGNNGFRANARGAGHTGPYTKESGILAYYEIQDRFPETRWDSEQCVPYAVSGDQWVGFDNKRSIQQKCEYIQRESLGGAMVWTIDMDERRGGAFTLLNTINRCL